MIRLDTVFVVGAGASYDYGFPLGEDLTKEIASALNFNQSSGSSPPRETLRTAIQVACAHPEMRRDHGQLFRQASLLASSLVTASSIDTFLDTHSHNPDFELLGKLAIAACLIDAEARSPLCLRQGQSMDLSVTRDTWLARLFRNSLAPGVKADRIEQMFEHVSFIVFNYDRCIEHYLEHAIASHFGVDLNMASRIVEKCRIVHPYGYLGPLHRSNDLVSFGAKYTPEAWGTGDAILKMSKNLLTFTESQKAESAAARELIRHAKHVVFLGFGFAEQNVELLKAPSPINTPEVRATVKGMSDNNREQVQDRIGYTLNAFTEISYLRDCDCATLISGEQMFLTRSS